MVYEIFQRRVHRVRPPTITFRPSGHVVFNETASRLIELGAAVHVLWNPETNTVGLRPVTIPDASTFTLRRVRGSLEFYGVSFFRHIGFDYRQRRRIFPAVWNADQGMFECCLNEIDGT
jgi:hypothetical protein